MLAPCPRFKYINHRHTMKTHTAKRQKPKALKYTVHDMIFPNFVINVIGC